MYNAFCYTSKNHTDYCTVSGNPIKSKHHCIILREKYEIPWQKMRKLLWYEVMSFFDLWENHRVDDKVDSWGLCDNHNQPWLLNRSSCNWWKRSKKRGLFNWDQIQSYFQEYFVLYISDFFIVLSKEQTLCYCLASSEKTDFMGFKTSAKYLEI